MRHRRLLAITAILAGCGAAPAAPGSTTPVVVAAGDPGATRVEPRGEVARRGVVRIGDPGCDDEATSETADLIGDEPAVVIAEDAPPERDERDASRPVLRLYGVARPAMVADVVALPGPEAPSIVPPPPRVAGFERLPMMGLPGMPEAVPAIPELPISVAPQVAIAPQVAPRGEDDAVVREYQAALGHVEARRWPEALAALERFVSSHPDHPYADNALYWVGEVLYAGREYGRAVQTLEDLVARYPSGNKVPDALLRIGFCLQRLGDPDRARSYFRRVRDQFPDSVAARMASREET